MKEILLILVGGTICTALTEHGTLSVSSNAGTKLVQGFMASDSPYKDSVNITTSENLGILSENMTVDKWNLILKTYKQEIAKKEYDGVIFAHGTDTLAYSASLFSMLLADTKTPVFFASSNARLGTPTANGDENFRCAVECICRGFAPNVYVPYKNISDSRMYLHLGSRLQQCPNYSEDFVSTGAIDITGMTDADFESISKKLSEKYPSGKRKSFLSDVGDFTLKNCILKLQAYVGLDYSVIDYSKFSAVLHGTYHSGTACAGKTGEWENYGVNSILYMLDECKKAGVDVYLSPSKKEGEVYDTVRIIGFHNKNQMNFLYGTTDEVSYAKLLIAYSVFKDENKRKEFLETEINAEFVYK